MPQRNELPRPAGEIGETEAAGVTAAIFADIKRCLQVPVVNLVYRRLATVPEALEWAWCSIRPAIVDGTLPSVAERLTLRAVTSSSGLDVSAVTAATPEDRDATSEIRAVVAAYNRANPQNLVIATCLLELLKTPRTGDDLPPADFSTVDAAIQRRHTDRAPSATPGPELPTMVDPRQMPPIILDKIAAFVRPQPPTSDVIVPSLYRHLAHWPEFLSAALGALTAPAAVTAVATSARQLEQDAQRHVRALTREGAGPVAVLQQPGPGVRQHLEHQLVPFARGAISRMIVAGQSLARALEAAAEP